MVQSIEEQGYASARVPRLYSTCKSLESGSCVFDVGCIMYIYI